jgi:hypothetical protein
MEDVGRAPEPSRLSPATEQASIPTLDGWIESLMTCKQLAEVDVQRLCEKVCQSQIQTSKAIGEFQSCDVVMAGPNSMFLGTRGLARRVERAASGKNKPNQSLAC